MYEVPNCLAEYLTLIRSGWYVADGLQVPDSEEFYLTVHDLNGSRFRRVGRLKKSFSILHEIQYIHDCRLKFRFRFPERAYMTDAGLIYFSLWDVLGSGGMTVTKLFLHEAAHLWLSRQPEYENLKALDKAFRVRYASEDAVALSPIEYYAITLSLLMLERLAATVGGDTRSTVLNQIEREKSMLSNFRAITD